MRDAGAASGDCGAPAEAYRKELRAFGECAAEAGGRAVALAVNRELVSASCACRALSLARA